MAILDAPTFYLAEVFAAKDSKCHDAIPGNRKPLRHYGNRPDDLAAISQMGNLAPLDNKLALPGRSFGLNANEPCQVQVGAANEQYAEKTMPLRNSEHCGEP
ncbi:hypothetical protein FVEN_g13036 [Fusarium venenatum]|uniref:Uncharacterized protein n=1 Tax=Fusarium venenatum TaxID=56646 RepID=A0A2L2T5H2_9HYPO|nr:uncharacterized protein FVRRES_11829 [Fusarium venenatum]KAG8351242.1 hypothetical protein FVEN_g13036 [Fusarium venenatum]CEI39138.1 unnamed protein product [Fusarium venenatum]